MCHVKDEETEDYMGTAHKAHVEGREVACEMRGYVSHWLDMTASDLFYRFRQHGEKPNTR